MKLLLTIVASSLGLLASTSLSFAAISYVETFDAAAGDPFNTTYTDWTIPVDGSGDTQSVSSGQLQVSMTSSSTESMTVLLANTVAGSANFDVSLHALEVSANIGGAGDSGGVYQVSMVVGDWVFIFHPGQSGGIHRVFQLSDNTVVRNNSSMGFTPTNDGTMYSINLSVIENGSDFDFNYSIGSFIAPTLTIPQADGNLDKVGFRIAGTLSGTGTGFYDDLQISQVPEPSTVTLLLVGLFGITARRKR